ncbi:unnamed protein product [Rotaria sordida]|uniref:WH2 domain-containing protein n=1 Tax=Rotaria sordida TaxID=392033 RepID=A0A818SID5_9BILA|nr:unnamed protein product [Rotaria sordida]
MPLPPPPPPPPPPLPSVSMTSSTDRSGLLNEIGNFKTGTLKKATTNDRSAPIIGGSANNNNNNNARISTTNRSNVNERPNTAPLITSNQLNATMLKQSAMGGSTGKVKRPSISQVISSSIPPPPPPPPVHQPVVKTSSFDQSRHEIDGIVPARNFTHQAPRLPPREPPPPPPSNESKPKLGHTSSSSIGSQQKITRAPPPPPPPPYSSTNNGNTLSNNISKSPKQINSNGPPPPAPPPPPPPPRGVAPTNNNSTIRRIPSDFVDHSYSDRRYDQSNSAALDYDHHFEARFRFTPLEYLPIPERWQPPPAHTRSSRHHINVH